MAKHFRRCAACGNRYDARQGHICPADVSPAWSADVKPAEGKASAPARISAADRRSVETALLRLMPSTALEGWRERCAESRDRAEDPRVWHYWQGRLATVRAILEARDCPPPRSLSLGYDEILDEQRFPTVAVVGEACPDCGAAVSETGATCDRCQFN